MDADRQTLERQAIEAVCARHYYGLMDTIEDAGDDALRAIIQGSNCPGCGL